MTKTEKVDRQDFHLRNRVVHEQRSEIFHRLGFPLPLTQYNCNEFGKHTPSIFRYVTLKKDTLNF